MPKHHERKTLPYKADQMYDLVAAMDLYPEFLPWCTGVRIRSREDGKTPEGLPCEIVTADVSIRFKMFRETFTSRDTLDKVSRTIIIEYLDGPFKYLENRWHFEESGEDCIVDFHIDFEFRSRALQALIGALFGHAIERLMRAFEERAEVVHGGKSDQEAAPNRQL